MRRAGIATGIVAVLAIAVPIAGAALPADGSWNYQGQTRKVHEFRIYLTVMPGAATITSIDGIADAKCSKRPRGVGLVSFSLPVVALPVKADGSFSTKWVKLRKDGQTLTGGKLKAKGKFSGTSVSGTVRVKSKGKFDGRCTIKQKFRAKGTPAVTS